MLSDDIKSQDWIVGQQIGVIAVRLANFEPSKISDKSHLLFRNQMGQLLIDKLDMFKKTYGRMWSLPVSTLNLLEVLPQGPAFKLLPRAQKAAIKSWSRIHEDVTVNRGNIAQYRPSQVNAANLISHQILYSDAPATSIARSAGDFLGQQLESVIDQKEKMIEIQRCLDGMRRSGAATGTLVGFAEKITTIMATHSFASYLIRNALFDHLLAWPLMILGSSKNVGPSGVSLPVGVDLVLNGRCETSCLKDLKVDENLRFDFENWRTSLEVAASTGKKMWRSKNGNTGALRKMIMEASSYFDFSLADRIMSGVPNWSLEAKDRSMEAYFAQIILSKAIGNHCGSAAAVTGMIGEQRILEVTKPDPDVPLLDIPLPEELDDQDLELEAQTAETVITEQAEVLDWVFDLPDDLDKKGVFVANSKKYNRYVTPSIPKYLYSKLRNLNIETNHCRYLSSVADCVQLGGWRQHRYLRCPDISHVIHINKSELRPFRAGAVIKTLATLKTNDQAVLYLDSDLDALTFTSALHHLNYYRRLASDQIPPSISWTFMRCVPEEQDLKFWSLLFKGMGISSDHFNKFRNAESPTESATVLANIFAQSKSGSGNLRQCVPDLVILLNHEKSDRYSENDDYFHHSHRHDIDLVFKKLNEIGLTGHGNETIRSFLADTRFIIIGNTEKVGEHCKDIAMLSKDERDSIARLQHYRFGFSQQMASLALSDRYRSTEELRKFLRGLVSKKILTYGGGQYHLRRLTETTLNMLPNHGQARMAKTHFAAAMGFAPYLSRHFVPGQNIANAMTLESVREAIYHFEKCSSHAGNHLFRHKDDQRIRRLVEHARFAQQKLKRYFDTVTLDLVDSLCRKRAGMPTLEIYQLAKELLTKMEEAQGRVQPRAYTTIARASQRHFERLEFENTAGCSHAISEIELFRSESIKNLQIARKIAQGHNRFKDELSFQVATEYSSFLHEHGKSGDEVDLRKQLDGQIDHNLNAGTRGEFLNAKWFQIVGDNQSSHLEALSYYRFGWVLCPTFFSNLVNMIGCEVLLDATADSTEKLRTTDAEAMERLCSFARVGRAKRHIDSKRRAHVADRYRAGARFVQEFRKGSSLSEETVKLRPLAEVAE